jgi:hypothetical protein
VRLNNKAIITLVSVTLCIILIIGEGFYFHNKKDTNLIVEVIELKDEEGMGGISTLTIKLYNSGWSSIKPAFSIAWTVTAYYWNILDGPQVLAGKSNAIYKIKALIAQAIIPNGETFIVKVNDSQDSVFSVSKPTKVDLKSTPPILNGGLEYWYTDPSDLKRKPFEWDVVKIMGPEDTFSASQVTLGGKNAIEVSAVQDGAKDQYFWAVGQVRQYIVLPSTPVGLWVYPTFTYKDAANPQNVFGVEINDGVHVFWFIFSDSGEGIYDLQNHRIIVTKAPLNKWSYHQINILEAYQQLGYPLPTNLMFTLIVGGGQNSPGTYTGYFSSVSLVP